MLVILDYFWKIEGSLANAKECYNEKVDEEYLKVVCDVITQLSDEDIDLDCLNDMLLSKA